ncbi:MAG: hypothetical protein ACJ8F0_14190 [Xanthobacteraceae bacterium]
MALAPVAFAVRPIAVELAPAAISAAHAPPPDKVPAASEEHCAKAGAAPSTVIMPAAMTSPRAPPPSALAPMRWARRLTGTPIAAPAIVMS